MELNKNIRRKTLEKIMHDDASFSDSEIMMHCPFCADRKKKRAGYNLDKDVFHCFHCGIGFPRAFFPLIEKLTGRKALDAVASVLKGDDPLVEPQKTELKGHKDTVVPDNFNKFVNTECVRIRPFSKDIPESVHDYLKSRRLEAGSYKFFYCNDKNSRYFGRLVIPFFDDEGNVIYFQARAMSEALKAGIKYLNPHGTKDVVFGIDKIDRSKPVPVLEGPIDSLFVENAVAIMSSHPSEKQMKRLEGLDLVFMLDNDKAGTKSMLRMARMGYKVVLWPRDVMWREDVNDFVLRTNKELLRLKTFVEPNLHQGFQAEVMLQLKIKEKASD